MEAKGRNSSAMKVIQGDVERRVVVEAYARYDCSKKSSSLPDFATWDWSRADAIDSEMRQSGLKCGVPAGYLRWAKVEIALVDLRECAVVANLFPGQSRKLGCVERAGGLVGWRPNRETAWHQKIVAGQTFLEGAPLLLRPAVSGEFPARWYIEDGSGRAVSFLANQSQFRPGQTLAIGYLGQQADLQSSFMLENFRELCTA